MALSAGRPAWVLPSTLPCGVRTFLERRRPRSPGRLLRAQYRRGFGGSRSERDARAVAPGRRGSAVSSAPSMRARVALVALPVLVLAACAREPVGPAAPIAPAQLAPGSRARRLRRATGRRRVRRGLPRVARSRGRAARSRPRGRPRSPSWVQWLDVQHREFDGTIRSAADVRDVEFIGARDGPARSRSPRSVCRHRSCFRFDPTDDDPIDLVRVLDGPVTLVRTAAGTYRVEDLLRNGVPMSDSIQRFRNQVRTEGRRDACAWIRSSCSRPSGSSTSSSRIGPRTTSRSTPTAPPCSSTAATGSNASRASSRPSLDDGAGRRDASRG